MQYYVPYTGVPSFTNGYSQSSITAWGSINLVTHSGYTYNEGIYTIAFDLATSATTGFAITQSSSAFTLLDGYSFTDSNTFDHVVIQVAKDHLASKNNLQLQFSQAQSVLKVDNLEVFYRPNTVDVTLVYNGEEYVAEDVATTGISADTILAAAGVEVPYGKKAVLSAINGGESVGNVVTPVIDSTYYVSFVDDDSITEFGKRLFLVDFENMTTGSTIDDQKSIATYTDNFNGDWSHLTINYEVGANTIAEADGNKFIKGTQGWAQIRINNANYATAPAGYYTMALSVMNFGDDSKKLSSKNQTTGGATATWVKGGSVVGTQDNYPIVNGVWNDVASELDHATPDFTIYHTDTMTTEVGFDNIALYYRPASVNLTVVDVDGTETVYENCDSVVDIDTLLADVTAPFGYKAALAIEKNGEPITGSINLVSDAKLYVVLVEDETVSMEYGKALYIIDFEREDMQGWAGTTIDVANSGVSNGAYIYTTASYYNDIFADKNYRVRFVVNETTLTDQKTVVDENGNHYTEGTATTKWPQVYQTNYGNVQYKAGYYTFMVDSKTTVAPSGYGFGAWTQPEGFSVPVNEWYTITGTQELTADGNLPGGGVWFNYSYTDDQIAGNVTVSWDNAKLYYKPYTVTVELAANGEVVATKENVSTAGVLVSELVSGVKVKGYTVTGVKLGTTTYGLDETVAVPCDCQLELALEVQDTPAATPETSTETSIRTDTPMGIRFKAQYAASEDDSVTEFGWVVARADQLDNAELTLDWEGNKAIGYGREDGGAGKFFETNDDYNIFTAVLFFAKTEDDGLPSAEKLATPLVARPFVMVDDEYIYGEAVTKSIFEATLDQFYAGSEEEWVFNILDKVDANADDIPDIFQ